MCVCTHIRTHIHTYIPKKNQKKIIHTYRPLAIAPCLHIYHQEPYLRIYTCVCVSIKYTYIYIHIHILGTITYTIIIINIDTARRIMQI